MNVWLVNHYALPPSASGITRHHDLATRLGPLGIDTTIVASSYDHYSRADRLERGAGDLAVRCTEGVRYAWVRTPPYGSGNAARARNMVSFARSAAKDVRGLDLPQPDVVIGSSPHLLAPVAARSLARNTGARFVMEVRDVWPESLIELGGPSRWHPAMVALGRIERSLYRSADHVVSVLPAAADHIRTVAGRPVDVTWIPNGAEVPSQRPARAPIRDRSEIVYAGTIGNANALDVVLEAAALLESDDAERAPLWRLVGPGPEQPRLKALAEERGLRTVRFEDPVPKRDVPALLASADACLLHLQDSPVFRWGTSPNKLFDYFAAARPVLFGVRTPHNAVADAGAGISFEPENPADLVVATRRLLSADAEERAQMGASGFDYLAAHHDLDVIAHRYARLLENLDCEVP